jgi:hypothetical protein
VSNLRALILLDGLAGGTTFLAGRATDSLPHHPPPGDLAAAFRNCPDGVRASWCFTAADALGDVSRPEVDALSVRANCLSNGVPRAAHRLGREAHV